MQQSFYTAALGAGSFNNKLSVVANNLANINNNGFKSKTVAFSDLLNYNLNDSADAVTNLMAGNGIRVQRTYTDFGASAVTQTNSQLDYAIMEDNAFFMVQDPANNAISYTRSGRFHRGSLGGDTFYLLTESNKLVLDREGRPIEVDDNGNLAENQTVGVYTFRNPSRLLNTGNDEYVPADEGAEVILLENPTMARSALESSGTDLAKEMTQVIESQRAFSYALKMVTTSDEIEATINSLRG